MVIKTATCLKTNKVIRKLTKGRIFTFKKSVQFFALLKLFNFGIKNCYLVKKQSGITQTSKRTIFTITGRM